MSLGIFQYQRTKTRGRSRKDKKLRGKLGRNKREKYFFSETGSREFFQKKAYLCHMFLRPRKEETRNSPLGLQNRNEWWLLQSNHWWQRTCENRRRTLRREQKVEKPKMGLFSRIFCPNVPVVCKMKVSRLWAFLIINVQYFYADNITASESYYQQFIEIKLQTSENIRILVNSVLQIYKFILTMKKSVATPPVHPLRTDLWIKIFNL